MTEKDRNSEEAVDRVSAWGSAHTASAALCMPASATSEALAPAALVPGDAAPALAGAAPAPAAPAPCDAAPAPADAAPAGAAPAFGGVASAPAAPAPGEAASEPFPLQRTPFRPCTQWCLYVSLDSRFLSFEEVKKRAFGVDRIVFNERINYSMKAQSGGYLYKEGLYAREESLCFLFVDVAQEKVEHVARTLRAKYEQESVLITAEPLECCYLLRETAGRVAGAHVASDADALAPGAAPADALAPGAAPADAPANAAAADAVASLSAPAPAALAPAPAPATQPRFASLLEQYRRVRSTIESTGKPNLSLGESPMESAQTNTELTYEPAESFVIYVGLEQRNAISSEEAKMRAAQKVIDVLRGRALAYSVSMLYGGYGFEDGFFEQDSLQITLIGAQEEDVSAVAEAICCEINQDTALITKSKVSSRYLTMGG